jgi:hypothetical protein
VNEPKTAQAHNAQLTGAASVSDCPPVASGGPSAPTYTFLATVQHFGVGGKGMRKEAKCVVEARTASEAAAAIENVFAVADANGQIIKLEQPEALAGNELLVYVFGEF